MDDNDLICKMLSMILEELGYSSTIVNDGKDAIEEYKKQYEKKDPYDLVIMDLIIPGGMGGKEAIKDLLKIDKNIKAIASSGYSDSDVISSYEDYGFIGRIPKPYTLDIVKNCIEKLI